MSVRLMARVWSQSATKGGELLVILALADFANDQGESWPSVSALAEKARLTERQARRVLDRLESIGEIRRQKSKGGHNHRNYYRITLAENPDKITLTKLQGKNYPVIRDQLTLTSLPGDLKEKESSKEREKNHHRTVNKTGANAPTSSTVKRRRKLVQSDPAQERAFARWYESYPKHEGRKPALKAWLKINPDPALVETIMAATARYVELKADVERQFLLNPTTWLNQEHWTDDIGATVQPARPQVNDAPRGDLRYPEAAHG